MNKNKGFTLVELLIVITVIAILMVMLIGVLNPIALVGKANDSKRKKDLTKIKIAFEEYYNDKGTYPFMENLVNCNLKQNCGKTIVGMEEYLKTCLCDSHGNPYNLILETTWFKAVTNLENKKDDEIPDGWYSDGMYSDSGFDKNEVNYGVSSSNILWYQPMIKQCDINTCWSGNSCNEVDESRGCNAMRDGVPCFRSDLDGIHCNMCSVPCCGAGCN